MSKPALGSVADELYDHLTPYHKRIHDGNIVTDEQLGFPLYIFFGLIARGWQEVEDMVRDTPEGPGWTALASPTRIKPEALDWQGQIVGVTMLPGMTTPAKIERINGTDGFRRGTPAALAVATMRHLTGARNVIINERLGGNAKRIGVVTWADETPDSELTRADIEEQLPWEIQLEYNVQDAWDYVVLRTAFDDYEGIRTHFDGTGYLGIRENDPPAT